MIVKPGYKTTEALIVVLAALASWVGHWAAATSTGTASRNTALVAVGYAVSRGLTKLGAYLGAAKATPPVVSTNVAATPPTPPAANVEGV